jgi:hypothetical protein
MNEFRPALCPTPVSLPSTSNPKTSSLNCAARSTPVAGRLSNTSITASAARRTAGRALDRLMAEARRGKVDVIYVWSLDRFGRSLAHVVTAVQDLHERGVAFVSLKEGLNINGRGTFAAPHPVRPDRVRACPPHRTHAGGTGAGSQARQDAWPPGTRAQRDRHRADGNAHCPGRTADASYFAGEDYSEPATVTENDPGKRRLLPFDSFGNRRRRATGSRFLKPVVCGIYCPRRGGD